MKISVLIAPGFGNSAKEHWQSLWELSNPHFKRVQQRDWENPVCEEWVNALEKAIEEGHLVPFEIATMTTQFMREGINQRSLSDEQIAELEAQGEDPNEYEFDSAEIDKAILNKDTNRKVIRNLMENGIKDKDNQLIGKSIIFARRIDHARLLKELFDEMYPSLSNGFCEVIHSDEPRAEALIDQFKITEEEKAEDPSLPDPITLAISVDMLDTGIDVPSVVNLVFAKPVKSKVKFWQMIGRGTRLCKDLFGKGKDKTRFQIFDHWNNFDYFEFNYKEVEPSNGKSLAQKRFELRLQLASAALKKLELNAFEETIKLLLQDIKALDTRNINVRDHWAKVEQLSDFKLLALDMDGTSLDSSGKLPIELINFVNRENFGDLIIVFATGRMPLAVYNSLERLNISKVVISHNGAVISNLENGKCYYENHVPSEIVQFSIELHKRFQVPLHLNLTNEVITDKITSIDRKSVV